MTDTPTESAAEGTWSRLRDRKVAQWGIAYVAGAWGFLQGLEYVGEAFGWPGQLRQVAILALLIGLPIVLVIAWYHGDRGEQRVGSAELVVIALLFLLGGGIFWLYQRGSESEPHGARLRATTPAVVAPTRESRPSIAVLPFDNRSANADDVYFVDGIHDDILMQLSRVGAMTVIARTSVEQFRDTKLTTREIGHQLGVSNVLEGGVQRAGDHVRVTVQLIDTATDAHLWADSYDRELTASNIFAIQSEIAVAVAAALNTELTATEESRVHAVPTKNLAAWQAYQLGRQQMAKRTSETLAAAEQYFQRAVDSDPTFALAYAGLADAIWLRADYDGQAIAPAMSKAKEFVDRALVLDADLAEAHATSGKFAAERRDFGLAETEYRKAIASNPNYAMAHQWFAQLLGMQGRDAEAAQHMRRAAELDPRSQFLQIALASGLSGVGSFAEALAKLDRARGLDPLSPWPDAYMGRIHATAFGRLDVAIPFLERAMELDPSGLLGGAKLATIYLDLGDEKQAEQLLGDARDSVVADATRGLLNLYRNEPVQALAAAREVLNADSRDRMALAVLRDADLQSNDATAARDRYARAYPELFQGQFPAIDYSNYGAAIDVALVLQRAGEHERAEILLDRSEKYLLTNVRMGPWGYYVSDVQIHALRGDKAEALAALREAQQAGWRGPAWRYYRDFDPGLATIRGEPEFKAVFADLERDLQRQRSVLAARSETAQ